MKRVAIVLIAVLVLISSCAKEPEKPFHLPSESIVVQGIRQSPPDNPVEKESSYDINQILFNDLFPGIGAGDKFGDGPWNHRIVFAESQNGRVWIRKPRIVAEQASAPEAIIDREGKIRVYFIDVKNNGISVAIWHNSRWIYKRVGIEEGAVYTGVVLTDDGNYRAYYQIGEYIYSAISSNGIYFDREEGVRFSGKQVKGFDVFKGANGWNLVVSDGGEFFEGFSIDGLWFDAPKGTGIKGFGGDVAKVGDEYKLYFHALYGKEYAAYSASSDDGVSWKVDSGIRLFSGTRLDRNGVANPSVIKIDENTYQMFYYSPIRG